MIASCGHSETGSVRDGNEDRLLMDERLSLFAIADGMGGHNYGEVAAELALATLQRYVDSSSGSDVTWPFGYDFSLSLDGNRLITAIQLANRHVWSRSGDTSEYAGMGTTVAAVLVTGNKAAIASVGDSRVYLFRAGALELLTKDDTWVGAMVRQGSLDPAEAPHHPMRNVLTQAAGAREDIHVHLAEQALLDGDLLLVSSDGLHGVVEEEQIRSLLGATAGINALNDTAAALIQAAMDRGAPDNVSCIVLRYTDDANSLEHPQAA